MTRALLEPVELRLTGYDILGDGRVCLLLFILPLAAMSGCRQQPTTRPSATAMLPSASQPATMASQPEANLRDQAIAAVFYVQGNPTREQVRQRRRLVAGLVGAVWESGKVVRVRDEGAIGESYLLGQLTGVQMAEFRSIVLDVARKGSAAWQMVIIDAPDESLYIRREGYTEDFIQTAMREEDASSPITKIKR